MNNDQMIVLSALSQGETSLTALARNTFFFTEERLAECLLSLERKKLVEIDLPRKRITCPQNVMDTISFLNETAYLDTIAACQKAGWITSAANAALRNALESIDVRTYVQKLSGQGKMSEPATYNCILEKCLSAKYHGTYGGIIETLNLHYHL